MAITKTRTSASTVATAQDRARSARRLHRPPHSTVPMPPSMIARKPWVRMPRSAKNENTGTTPGSPASRAEGESDSIDGVRRDAECAARDGFSSAARTRSRRKSGSPEVAGEQYPCGYDNDGNARRKRCSSTKVGELRIGFGPETKAAD